MANNLEYTQALQELLNAKAALQEKNEDSYKTYNESINKNKMVYLERISTDLFKKMFLDSDKLIHSKDTTKVLCGYIRELLITSNLLIEEKLDLLDPGLSKVSLSESDGLITLYFNKIGNGYGGEEYNFYIKTTLPLLFSPKPNIVYAIGSHCEGSEFPGGLDSSEPYSQKQTISEVKDILESHFAKLKNV